MPGQFEIGCYGNYLSLCRHCFNVVLYTRSSVIGSHFHQVGGAGMGVSHCVVLRRMVHQVVGSLSGGISTRVLSDGTCPAPTIWDGRSHLVREEELGLAELKVTVSGLCVVTMVPCSHGHPSPVFRSYVTPWLLVTLGCSETSACF